MIATGDATARQLCLVDPVQRRVTTAIKLNGTPEGVAWSADGRKIFVAECGAASIAEVDYPAGRVARRFATGRYPAGLAITRRHLLVCDRGLDQLLILDPQDGTTVARLPVGRQPDQVAVSPDESLAVVSNLLPATPATAPDHATEVTVIDLEKMRVRAAVRLPTGSTNARGIAIDAAGEHAYVVHTLGRFHLPTTQLDRGWVNTNALSIIHLPSGRRAATVLLDQVMDGAADPWGVAVDPAQARLHVTLSGVHQLATIELDGLAEMLGSDPDEFTNDLAAMYREGLIERLDLPVTGPRGIAAQGGLVVVAGYFSGELVVLDPAAGSLIPIPLGTQPRPDAARLGEIVFHDANRAFQRWLSCASCHPNARADGLNWDLLNDGIGNPKNARSMLLSHATPPVMSLGVRDRMETAVRAGFVHIQFTQPGDDEVEAVAAYLKALEPAVSPHREADGSLTDSAARGEEIFNRPAVGCAHCHPAPLFTGLKLRDVGTSSPLDQGASEYDTPTLVELWRTPPYLHDGRAATLREVLVEHNPDDLHGRTSRLSTTEIDDLVNYLLSL